MRFSILLNINALKRCQESIDDCSNNTCIKGKTAHWFIFKCKIKKNSLFQLNKKMFISVLLWIIDRRAAVGGGQIYLCFVPPPCCRLISVTPPPEIVSCCLSAPRVRGYLTPSWALKLCLFFGKTSGGNCVSAPVFVLIERSLINEFLFSWFPFASPSGLGWTLSLVWGIQPVLDWTTPVGSIFRRNVGLELKTGHVSRPHDAVDVT